MLDTHLELVSASLGSAVFGTENAASSIVRSVAFGASRWEFNHWLYPLIRLHLLCVQTRPRR